MKIKKIFERAFKDILDKETSRILNQQPKFYNFLHRSNEKAFANFLRKKYIEAHELFIKTEKRIYCEMLSNKNLSLDAELFNYITYKDDENSTNREKLTLVFFV